MVECAEDHADGVIGESQMAEALAAVIDHRRQQGAQAARHSADHATLQLGNADAAEAAHAAAVSAAGAVGNAARGPVGVWAMGYDSEHAAQAALLRCIFVNTFVSLPVVLAWRTPLTADLARAAYENRHLPDGNLDAVRLSVLADALEEAGCTDETVLAHLRSPGPHVRGCWALDLLLRQE
jgi:hypothetical protein